MTKNLNKPLLLLRFGSFLCATLFCSQVYASEADKFAIEIMSDATVFAKLDDKVPAVVNYFTKNSETSIVAFYEDKYGKAVSSNRKRGRLEKAFEQNNYRINVIISEQNNQRQVDVLVTK